MHACQFKVPGVLRGLLYRHPSCVITASIKRMSTNCAGLIDTLLQAVRELCNPRRDMAVASAQLHRALDSQEELDGSSEEAQPLQSSLAENSDGAQASQDYFGKDPGGMWSCVPPYIPEAH